MQAPESQIVQVEGPRGEATKTQYYLELGSQCSSYVFLGVEVLLDTIIVPLLEYAV